MAGSRQSCRLFVHFVCRPHAKQVPVPVCGAGDGGETVVRECGKNPAIGFCPVGFLDDKPTEERRTVQGLRILGGADQLPQILERNPV